MVIKTLISLGLALVPFLVWHGFDTRIPKENLSLLLALSIGLFGVFNGNIKKFCNIPLLILIGFIFISKILAPPFQIPLKVSYVQDIGDFWVYKPMYYCMVYFLMLLVVSSLRFDEKDIKILLNVMMCSALIMSLYCIGQYFGFQQFFDVKSVHIIGQVTKPGVVGTLGNSTIVSPYIAMCIPFALSLGQYVPALIMILAVLATKSQISLVAMIISLIFYFLLNESRIFKAVAIIAIITLIGIGLSGVYTGVQNKDISSLDYWEEYIGFDDNGRFNEWNNILKDWNTPALITSSKKYNYSGMGIGAYRYIYKWRNRTESLQAHNEYLEFLYNTGIVGFLLFLSSIVYVFWKAIYYLYLDDEILPFISSFLCIALCAFGTFVWQLGAHTFYTIVILGIIHSKIRENDYGIEIR